MDEDMSRWLDASAALQADADADLRADAFEVYRAEAARTRLSDRRGWCTMALRCGRVLAGELIPARGSAVGVPDGFLRVRGEDGGTLLVRSEAVVMLRGSTAGLRDEGTERGSLTTLLRECWALDGTLRALLADGSWLAGRIVLVGADHVELRLPDETLAVPIAAVEVWDLGDVLD